MLATDLDQIRLIDVFELVVTPLTIGKNRRLHRARPVAWRSGTDVRRLRHAARSGAAGLQATLATTSVKKARRHGRREEPAVNRRIRPELDLFLSPPSVRDSARPSSFRHERTCSASSAKSEIMLYPTPIRPIVAVPKMANVMATPSAADQTP